MVKLVKLNPDTHGSLTLGNCVTDYAANQHMFPVRVTEIAQAISSFPVLISRVQDVGELSLSMLCSFVPGSNLFVLDGEWQSSFQPLALSSAPFYIIPDPDDPKTPIMAIDEDSTLLNNKDGDPVFDKKGKLPLALKQLETRLNDDISHQILTRDFLQTVDQLGLLNPVDVVLNYQDGSNNRIRGLNMIHESKLQSLDGDQYQALRTKGFLPPLYAMLFSVFQLNNLIRLHNAQGHNPISKINLEVTNLDRPI